MSTKNNTSQASGNNATRTEANTPAVPPTPPATPSSEPMYTKEQVDHMVNSAVQAVRNEIPVQVPAAVHTTVNVMSEQDKRNQPIGSADISEEDYTPDTLRIYHSGTGYTHTMFIHKGRKINLPREKFARFQRDNSRGTARFGSGENLVFRCYYDSNSKEEQRLFREDDRWGNEFWTVNSREVDGLERFATIVSNFRMSLAGLGSNECRNMAKDLKIPTGGTPDELRMAIATKQARMQFEAEGKGAILASIDKEKEALLTGNGK